MIVSGNSTPTINEDTKVFQLISSYLRKGFLSKKGKKLMNSGEKFIGLKGVKRLSFGLNNAVYVLSVEYRTRRKSVALREYVIRLYPKITDDYKVQNEVTLMKQIEDLQILVPKVYIYEKKKKALGYEFIIMDKIEGKPVINWIHTFSPEETRAFLADLAECLGKIHNLRSKKYTSYYLKEKTIKKLEFSEYILNEIKTILKRFRDLELDKEFDLDIMYVLKWFKGHLPLLNTLEGYSLVHGDLRPSNIMCHESLRNITGILDWEMGCYSDPAYDLGWTLFFFKLYDNIRSERGYFFKEYWKYCEKYNFEARVNFYEVFAAIKIFTYAQSIKLTKPEKYEDNKEFFDRVTKEVPKYIDRIAYRD